MNNKEQQLAIRHREGACMVLAGPGSGKTFTITRRIENLIKRCKVRPEAILVITFTRAAAGEMKERFLSIMPQQGRLVTFGTFHGIFYGILKWAYKLGAESILSEDEKYRILQEVLEKEEPESVEEKDFVQDLLSEISLVKNHGADITSYRPGCCSQELFVRIYEAYEKKRCRMRKLDFDDMLLETRRLFLERKDVLSLWQEKFQYILIDEFQDINPIQYEVIRMLASPQDNLFIVGDDDQSIYRFRGAKPEIMLNFPKDYPNAQVISLSQNYRSTKKIVQIAGKVIQHNQKRYQKTLTTDNEEGESVHIQELRNVAEESRYLITSIRERIRQGVKTKQIAVLYRSAADARVAAETFMEEQIPFVMKDRIFNLYEHFIARDICAYFRLAMGERDRKYFLRIMNRPNRYISRNAIDKGRITFEDLRKYYSEMDWMQERIEQMECDIRQLSYMTPYSAIMYLRKSVGYDLFLKEYAYARQIKEEDLFDILYQLEERAKECKSFAEWFTYIEEYTARLLLQAEKKQEDNDGVRFLTMHGAKGLEFDTVYIIGANEGIVLYKKAETLDEMEEERRMFYVAMTRAKRKLVISYVKTYRERLIARSRFVDEILEGT